MATWLAGCHGDRFKAICSERAVNNMITEEFTSDIATVFRVEVGPSPIDAPEEYVRISPIRFVRDINVPMLILHSENDFRCPISQAEELFTAMRLLGKDVTFYRFPAKVTSCPAAAHRSTVANAPRSSSTSSPNTSSPPDRPRRPRPRARLRKRRFHFRARGAAIRPRRSEVGRGSRRCPPPLHAARC